MNTVATDRVYLEIRELLSLGELLPGQRIPNERKLAELKSASRTQVRDQIVAARRSDKFNGGKDQAPLS